MLVDGKDEPLGSHFPNVVAKFFFANTILALERPWIVPSSCVFGALPSFRSPRLVWVIGMTNYYC